MAYDTEWDPIEVWTMLSRTKSDWGGEFWVSCEFEMGMAVDG